MKEDTRGYRGLEGITDNLFSKEDIARYLFLVYFVYRGSRKLQAVTWDYKGWQGVHRKKLQKIIDVKSNGISSIPKEKNINVKLDTYH